MYRFYVTDSLQLISKNGGTYLVNRYYEKLYPNPDDDKTGDELASDIISRAGLTIKDENDGFI